MFTKNTPKIKCFQIIHGQVVIHVSAREQLLEVCTSMKNIQQDMGIQFLPLDKFLESPF